MSRLVPFTLVTAFAVCLSAFAQREPTAAPQGQPVNSQERAQPPKEKAAKTLADCMLECAKCASHCGMLVGTGKKEHMRSMQLCKECADVCGLTAQLVCTHSPILAVQSEACAKVCDMCAEACEKSPNDERMKACAKMCRECAKSCRDMNSHAPAQPQTER